MDVNLIGMIRLEAPVQPFFPEGAVFLGSRHSDRTRNTIAHSHDFYELNFLTSGKTKMRINGQEIKYESYDFLLIPPGVEHILHESEYERFDNYVIWFRLEGEAPGNDHIIKLHDYDGAVQFLCASIYRMYMNGGMGDSELINAYLQAVLLHMKQGLVMGTRESAAKEDVVENAVRFIHANIYKQRLTVSEIAGTLNISSAYFTRQFKEKIGISPIKYIIEVKMAEAKRLLMEQGRSIQEVASLLQYEDPLYFSRQFTRNTGLSPRAFRRNNEAKMMF